MIAKMDVRGVRLASRDRDHRKRLLSKFILDQVKSMKEDVAALEVIPERECVVGPWRTFVHSLR